MRFHDHGGVNTKERTRAEPGCGAEPRADTGARAAEWIDATAFRCGPWSSGGGEVASESGGGHPREGYGEREERGR